MKILGDQGVQNQTPQQAALYREPYQRLTSKILSTKRLQIIHVLIALVCVLSLIACGGGDSGPVPIGGGLAVGQVQALEFDSNGEASANFSELSGSEEFAFLMLAANVNEGSFNVQLKSGAGSATPTDKLLTAPNEILKEVELGQDATSAFHEILREEEYLLGQVYQEHTTSGAKLLAGSQSASASGGGLAGSSSVISCAGGAGIQIKILNSLTSTSTFDTVCALVRRSTNNALYVVEDVANHNISDGLLNALVDEFESKIGLERDLLGSESDVNQDGRFVVCFCAGVNRLGQTAGGFITGFFFGGDLFSASALLSSNEMEIFYVAVPDPSGTWGTPLSTEFYASNIGPTVLPHEFQHMINFNQKALIRGVGSEDSWANEGLSHLMEDLHPNTHLNQVSKENPSRAAIYLSSPETAAFTGGTSLAQRGGSYLFFRYLCEQANLGRYPTLSHCDDLLTSLLQSDFKGVENIETITSISFKDLLLDFFATLQLSNTGLTSDPRYNFSGIDLQSEQDDNRGTVLTGANLQDLSQVPVSGLVNSPGGIFYNATGNTIVSSGNVVNFSAAPGMVPGGAVIRLR